MRNCLLLIFYFLIQYAVASTVVPDSIMLKINTANAKDIAKVYNKSAESLLEKDNKLALHLAQLALKYATELEDKKEILIAQEHIGTAYYFNNQYRKAIEYFEPLIDEYNKLNMPENIAMLDHRLGGAYYFLGRYEKAHFHFLKSLEHYIKIDNKEQIGNTYNNLSSVYNYMEDYDKSMEYALKGLEVNKENGLLDGVASSYNNIANIYFEKEEYIKTIEYNLKALEVKKKINDASGIATAFNNIAGVYFKKEDYRKAMEYYKEALAIYDSLDDKRNVSMVTSNIGFTVESMGNPREALFYYKKSYQIAKEIDYSSQILFLLESFAIINDSLGNYKKAYQYLDTLYTTKDTIFNNEKHKQIAELEAQFQNTQKENQIQLLSKDAKIQQEKLKHRNLLLYSFAGATVLFILMSLSIWRSFRVKKKANVMLKEQNWQIMEQNEELQQQREEILAQREEIEKKSDNLQIAYNTIEKKNKNITDSIIYAKRIQTALLANSAKIESFFKDFFIFLKPKDIVSGDFYWIEKIDNKIFIAVIDCTGHGVPGAFMSIIANNLLDQTIIHNKIHQVEQIFNELNKGLHKALYTPDERNNVKDGMDMAMCVINTETKSLEYSGAHNSVYIVRNHTENTNITDNPRIKLFSGIYKDATIIELKPDKFPIGKYFADEFTSFNKITFNYNQTDQLFMFSDGFVDQFGGEHNRKYMHKRFRQLIAKHSNLSMNDQKLAIEKEFMNWKSNFDQVDDVLLIGLQLDI